MTDPARRLTIRPTYVDDALPIGTDGVTPSGQVGDWAAARLARLTRPSVFGLSAFQRHLRHPGQLVVRTRARYRPRILEPDSRVHANRRVILAWRPYDENLPTALTWAHHITVDRNMLVDGARGTREAEIHFHPARECRPCLAIGFLSWPPEIHRLEGHRQQYVVPTEHIHQITWRLPRGRLH